MLNLSIKVSKKEVQRHRKNELEENHQELRPWELRVGLQFSLLNAWNKMSQRHIQAVDLYTHWDLTQHAKALCGKIHQKPPVSRRAGKIPLFSPTQCAMNLSSHPSSRTRTLECRIVFQPKLQPTLPGLAATQIVCYLMQTFPWGWGGAQLAENLAEQKHSVSCSYNPCPSRCTEGFHCFLCLFVKQRTSESTLSVAERQLSTFQV